MCWATEQTQQKPHYYLNMYLNYNNNVNISGLGLLCVSCVFSAYELFLTVRYVCNVFLVPFDCKSIKSTRPHSDSDNSLFFIKRQIQSELSKYVAEPCNLTH